MDVYIMLGMIQHLTQQSQQLKLMVRYNKICLSIHHASPPDTALTREV
jgi:hypothetical protein